MPYKVGDKGSYGCDGYPAVKQGGEVVGCHKTKAKAAAQIYAINLSEGNIGKSMPNLKEGDFAMTAHGGDEEFHIGQVVHVMREGMLGVPGGEYTLEATAENPAVLIQLFEQEEDGYWEATRTYSACTMSLMIPIDPLPQEPEMAEVEMAMYDAQIGKAYEGCGCPTCKELNVNCENCPVCKEDMGKSYHSEDEETDKWDNIEKACWVGYEQQGMKEKDGRMVPNCVPKNKSDDVEKAKKPNYEEMIKPRSGGSDPANSRLYTRIVQEAKDKFDVYPSAVANAWVVAEYKKRGGTYKAEKELNTDNFWKGFLK